jgi:hypothetical protein
MRSMRTEVRTGTRGRRVAVLLAISVVGLASLALGAAKAEASSSYEVRECYPERGVNTGNDLNVWGDYNQSTFVFGEDCTTASDTLDWHKGIVFHAESFDSGPRSATAQFVTPPGTYFNSGSVRWDIGARNPSCDPSACWWSAFYIGNNGTPYWSYGMSGTPNSSHAVWNNCGGCTDIWESMSCNSLCVHDTSTQTNGDWYYDYVGMRDLEVTLVDVGIPKVALSGSLFDNQIAHGTATLHIGATDVGGGVRTATVEVNGAIVATPATNCPSIGVGASAATAFRPCTNLSTDLQLDTTKTPWRDGDNTLRVCVYDVNTGPGSGNATCEQRGVAVDNTCTDSTGAGGPADSIGAGLENPKTGQLTRTRTVRSSESTALRGQLRGPGGTVIAASVCVYETVDEPAGIEQLLQVAKTNSGGGFGVEIPGGPSRAFRVAYRYNDRQIESDRMYLESSVLPALELNKSKLSNGHAVRFTGHIPGPHNNGRGVTMQAKVGKKWRSFKQLQTDANGEFKGKYRFTQTHGRVTYVFRALVKKQGGYPYSEGASQRRKVLVYG